MWICEKYYSEVPYSEYIIHEYAVYKLVDIIKQIICLFLLCDLIFSLLKMYFVCIYICVYCLHMLTYGVCITAATNVA